MRNLWRFLRYGPTALKVQAAEIKRLNHDLLLQGADIETLRKEHS